MKSYKIVGIKEFTLFLLVFYWSLVPLSKSVLFDQFGGVFRLRELFFLLVAIIPIVGFIIKGKFKFYLTESDRVFSWLLLLVINLFISVFFVQFERVEYFYAAATTLVNMFSLILVVLYFSRIRNFEYTLLILSRWLCIISVIYVFISVIDFGVRGDFGSSAEELGVGRAKGPLYYVSTGGYVLTIAFVFILNFYKKRRAPICLYDKMFLALCFVGIAGTGSRVAILSVIIVFIFSMDFRKLKTQIGLLVVLLVVFYIINNLVSNSVISLDRFQRLLAEGRTYTYFTAISAWLEDWTTIFFGNGFYSVWQWRDLTIEDIVDYREDVMFSIYGFTLYHPHSDFFQLLAHGGLMSISLYFIFWFQALLKVFKSSGLHILLAFSCVFIMGLFETYYFFRFELSFISLLYMSFFIDNTKEELS
ncbi:hypothetical protein CKO50_14640 [Pseudoalteromonas sp. HM-SA03]|uniref:O-antigen ligase family protein n=1 Tax=Pseudoalteromonas sp. HM-SA03 TaxID=2029678 RepID=UPI000BAE0BC8|nr:O-antigen ligase family protein [Pseudoalteromonas sp. HM-SA03]PAY00665.1 hypothetical protein CKO50_14640 [Pseudoalteromonas sp. HM-SA03]